MKKASLLREKWKHSGTAPLFEKESLENQEAFRGDGDDQEDILKQIEALGNEQKKRLGPEAFHYKALRKGYVLPLLVNIAALLVLSLGILVLSLVFTQRERWQEESSFEILGSEGRLLEAMRQESEAQLREKNQEISSINQRLQEIAKEKNTLSQNMTQQIESREKALRDQLSAELEEERKKLRSQGTSETEINRLLAQRENQQKAEFEQRVNQFRNELAAERQKLEAGLRQVESDYQQGLLRARNERDRLLGESSKREEELKAQLARQASQSQRDLSQAQAAVRDADSQIKRLSEQRDQERAVSLQLNGFYSTLREQLRRKSYDEGSNTLRLLRSYLQSPQVEGIESLRQRKDIELFVSDSLLQLIEKEKQNRQLETSLQNALVLQDIKALYEQARQLQAAGRSAEAEGLFRRLLERIPEVNESHQALVKNLGPKAETVNIENERARILKEAQESFQFRLTQAQNEATRLQGLLDELSRREKDYLDRLATQERLSQRATQDLALSNQDKVLLLKDNDDLKKKNEELALLVAGLQRSETALQDQLSAQRGLLEAEKGSGGETQQLLTQIQEENVRLAQELDQAREESRQVLLRLEEKDGENEGLQRDLRDLKNSLSKAGVYAESYASLIESYAVYAKAMEDSSSDPTGLKAKVSLDSFLTSPAFRALFPGVYERVNAFDKAYEKAGRDNLLLELGDKLYTLAGLERADEKAAFLEEQVRVADNDLARDFYRSLAKIIDKK